MNESNSNNGKVCSVWLRVKLPKELHRDMKMMALQESKSLQELTVELLHAGSAPKKIEVPVIPCEESKVTAPSPAKFSAYTR